MRYLSLVFISLLLVGCAQSTDVESVIEETDMQSQQEVTEAPEVEQEIEESTPPETEEPAESSEETESVEAESNETESTEDEQTETEEVESAEPTEEVIEEEPAEEEVVEEPEEVSSVFTMAMVSENDDASSCWSVINGNVYDLTGWISEHPGREGPILGLCGIDGSSAFNGRHGGQSNPANELQSFLLGPLS